MTDPEVAQKISAAGFVYDLGTGRYAVEGDAEESMDFVTEEISDNLGIPLADLLRWEENHQARDSRHRE
jgi:hypothetical protein